MRRLGMAAAALIGLGIAAWAALEWTARSYHQPYALIEEGLYLGEAVDEPPSGTDAVVNGCGRQDRFLTKATLWEPVFEDGREPDLEWLRRTTAFIAEQRKAGRTVFVHCLAGMNRSGTVTTAYLMQSHGWSRDEALAFIQKRRPQMQPNPAMMRLLAEWGGMNGKTAERTQFLRTGHLKTDDR